MFCSRPIDDLVLQMKSMDIEKVIHFPFPTPPDIQQLYAAERRLLLLNALEPPPRSIGLKRKINIVFQVNFLILKIIFCIYRKPRMDVKNHSTRQSHGSLSISTTLCKDVIIKPTK